MASNQAIVERQKKLIALLESTSQGKSIKELCDTLNVSLRTINSDINELRKNGNIIYVKKGVVALQSKANVVVHSSKTTMRRVKLLMELSEQGRLNKKSFLDGLIKQYEEEEQEKEQRVSAGDIEKIRNEIIEKKKKKADAMRKNIENDLKALVEEKMLRFDGETYISTWITPTNMYRSDKELKAIYERMMEQGWGEAYGDVLKEIAKKLFDAMQYKLLEEEHSYVDKIIYDKKQITAQETNEILQKLLKCHFDERQMKIHYVNRYGKAKEACFSLGMIIYACDHAKIYLLGKDVNSKQDTIIDMSRVRDLEELPEKNEWYHAAIYEDIFYEMFKVSVEACYEVKVEFEHILLSDTLF